VLRSNVAAVRAALAERTPACRSLSWSYGACASTHFLGLASRVVAPVFGAAAPDRPNHRPGRPPNLRWQEVIGGPLAV